MSNGAAPSGAAAGGEGGGANAGGAGTTVSHPASYFDGMSEESRAWAQSKGYKGTIDEVGRILGSYQALEKQLGASIRVPGADAKPEDRAAFYEKLGRPKSAADYKLESFKPAEGVDPAKDPTLGWFREASFNAGLSEQQADAVAASFATFAAKAAADEEAARVARITADEKAVRDGWGAEAGQRERAVLALAKATGLEQQEIAGIVSAIGVKRWSEIASGLGMRLLEADHGHGDDTLGSRGTFGMSREEAKAQLDAIREDSLDPAKRAEWLSPAGQRRMAELARIAAG